MRFLMSRGFAPSVVIQLLNEQTAFDNEGKKPSAEEEAELARLIDTLESD